MYKIKVFCKEDIDNLEYSFNTWAINNPNILIIDFKYEIGKIYNCTLKHSIIVLYKEIIKDKKII